MHPTVIAELATQRRVEMLHAAEARRLARTLPRRQGFLARAAGSLEQAVARLRSASSPAQAELCCA
jgi:hypothetical protein